MLVVVGVGLGKIRVLICCVVYLICYYWVYLENILVVMFINKVVWEMKDCIGKLFV